MNYSLKLFVYEFCPFCTRARTILGLKDVEYDLSFVEFADEKKPISMVGEKKLPIVRLINGKAFAESGDIVKYVDNNFNGPSLLSNYEQTHAVTSWVNNNKDSFHKLVFPRYYSSNLPELARSNSRELFRTKKEKMCKTTFEDSLKNSSKLIKQMEIGLLDLDQMMQSDKFVNDKLSFDDLAIFSYLRGLTIVKDLGLPPKLQRFVNEMSKKSDVRLFNSIKL